jgi:hypothetical protein
MDSRKMKVTLQQRERELREELLNLEKEFNTKKETYLKVQGALEALQELNTSEEAEVTE